jgi:hypothetical protein
MHSRYFFGAALMPRYYFNVIDGRSIIDDEGTELADPNAAKMEAIHLIGGILRDLASVPERRDWRIEVASEGSTIFSIALRMDNGQFEERSEGRR